jgi:hypothetical protein
MTDGNNTTDQSFSHMPGEPFVKDASGQIINRPETPTVDADADMNDHGQMEDVVDQQQENVDTGKNEEPAPADTEKGGTATG